MRLLQWTARLSFVAATPVLLFALVASAQTSRIDHLKASAGRPTVRMMLDAFDGQLPTRNPFLFYPYTAYGDQWKSYQDQLPMAIAQLEKAYPNAIFAGLGRDMALFIDTIDAFYMLQGEPGRAVHVNLSGASIKNASDEEIVEFIRSIPGLDLGNLESARPIVFLDGTRYNHESQSRRIMRALYADLRRRGENVESWVRKLNFVSLAFDGYRYYPQNLVRQTNLESYFAQQEARVRDAAARGSRSLEPDAILSIDAWGMTHGWEWHGPFEPLGRDANGRLVAAPGPRLNGNEYVLGAMFENVRYVQGDDFLDRVVDASRSIGFTFPQYQHRLDRIRKDFSEAIRSRDKSRLSDAIERNLSQVFPIGKARSERLLVEMIRDDRTWPKIQSVVSELGLSLFVKGKLNAEQAGRFAAQVFSQEPSDVQIGAVGARAKIWLRMGSAETIGYLLAIPWIQGRLQADISWFEALLEGARTHDALEAHWDQIKPLAAVLAQSSPQIVLRLVEVLPNESRAQLDWIQTMLALPVTAQILEASESPVVQRVVLDQKLGSEAGFDFDSLVSYLGRNRAKISASVLARFLENAPAAIDTPLRLATLIDLFSGPEYRDAFDRRIKRGLSGDAKVYTLRALYQTRQGAFEQLTGVSSQAKVQDLAPQSLRDVAFSVVENGVASVTVSRLAPLGKLGVRLFGQSARGGVVSDIHVTNANEQRLLLRVLSAARVVGLKSSLADANGSALPQSVLLRELEFELADGSKIGWQDVMAEMNRARMWKEILKTERGLEEARMNALEMRLSGGQRARPAPQRQAVSCQIIFGN